MSDPSLATLPPPPDVSMVSPGGLSSGLPLDASVPPTSLLSQLAPPTRPMKTTAAGAILTGGYNTFKVYIGNLPETATLADLEDCFGQLGQCTCSIKRGFGFVEYTDAAAAAEAVAKYHEGHFLGAQIKVELSHARQPPPKPVHEEGKAATRNPPGSDRPSDSRKPMHINGPPAAEKVKAGGRGARSSNGGSTPIMTHGANGIPPPLPPPIAPDYRRDIPFDRYGAPPGRDLPPPLPRDVPYDRYRDDYRDPRGPPPQPYSDPRYARDDRGYGPPPPSRDYRAPPPGYGPPPPRDERDRIPYDPYYDQPPPPSWADPRLARLPPSGAHPLGSPVPGYPAPDLQRSYGAPLPPQRDPYASDRYDSRPPPGAPLVPPFDQSGRPSYPPLHDPYGPPPPGLDSSGTDRYDPRGAAPLPPRDDRSRYNNPYSRSPPRDERRNGGGIEVYGGRSPHRGAPPSERRRSLSPRRDQGYRSDFAPPPAGGPSYNTNYPQYPPAGRSPPRYPATDEYNPRR